MPSREINNKLKQLRTPYIDTPIDLKSLLKRPEISIQSLLRTFNIDNGEYDSEVLRQAEIRIKYEGYINRQLAEVKKLSNIEKHVIPEWLEYHSIKSLTYEAREKLGKIKPNTIGQASRIAGVSPADISVLLMVLKQKSYEREHLG